MTLALRIALAGAGLALGLLAAGAASAATKSPAMQACSDQWAQLKADDKVPTGQTWPKFWSQCAKDYAAAHPADTASAADKTAPPPEEPAPAKTKSAAKAAPASDTSSGKGKSPAMQACSDQWAQLKADDKVPAGQTWPKFWSQCAKDYAAAHPSDAAAAAAKAAPPPEEPAPAKTKSAAKTAPAAAPADDSAGGKGKSPAMAACSDEWAKLKADDKVPAGQTWPKFWSQCAKDYAAAHPDDAAPAKNATKAKAAKADDEDLGAPLPDPEVAAKVDPNKPAVTGKREPTPGQKAAWARMRSCGAEWQGEKKAGTLPAGAKWPQYWSDCNKRLKAKGQ